MTISPQWVEPIILDYKGQHWTHPHIEDIIKNENFDDECNSDVWMGPIVRIYFTDENNKDIYGVFAMDKEFYDSLYEPMVDDEKPKSITEQWNKLYEYAYVMLVEDVWAPDGNQFCFTEFGKSIPSKLKVTFASPDVGIHLNDDKDPSQGWGWSS